MIFSILFSIFVCAAASFFCARVVSTLVSAPYVVANITLEDVAVLGECCPSSRDSSLNLIVLVFICGGISLSQVDVAFNVLDLSVVDIYLSVGFHHHLCLRRFIFRPCVSLLSANSGSICCSSWCINACEYVVGEAKMTKIFDVYLQASGFSKSFVGICF